MTTKCYSYVRFSSKKQEHGLSLRRQTERTEKWIARNPDLGLELDNSTRYQDLGVSAFDGANAETGKLGEFREAVRMGLVEAGSYLLVESLDRLSRATAWDAMSILRDIVKSGIIVVTLIDEQVYTKANIDDPMKLIMGLLIYIRANEESATKRDRSNANWKALRQKASTGKVMSNNAVSWLTVEGEKTPSGDNRRFVENEEKAEIVRRIVDLFLSGKGCQAIARKLNDEHVPMLRNGAMWQPRSIHSILINPAICGRYVMGEKATQEKEPPIDGYYPALISVDKYNEISLMLGNGNVKDRAKVANPLAAIVFCSACGKKMTRDNNINKGRVYEKLICSAAKVGKCNGSYKSIDLAYVFDHVKAIVFSEKLFGKTKEAELDRLKLMQAGLDTQISQTLELLFLQGHSKALGSRLAALEGEKAEIDAAIDVAAGEAVLSGSKAMNDRLRDARAAITANDVAKSNGLLRRLFSRITVDPFTKTVDAHWVGE
jgi:DNA invertase Pin-like site-specific DNA recombinase